MLAGCKTPANTADPPSAERTEERSNASEDPGEASEKEATRKLSVDEDEAADPSAEGLSTDVDWTRQSPKETDTYRIYRWQTELETDQLRDQLTSILNDSTRVGGVELRYTDDQTRLTVSRLAPKPEPTTAVHRDWLTPAVDSPPGYPSDDESWLAFEPSETEACGLDPSMVPNVERTEEIV